VQPAPREDLLSRDPVPSRRRRSRSRLRQAFRDNPKLLLIRPATSTPGIDHFKATDLMTVSNDIHTDHQLSTRRFTRGGLRRMDTTLLMVNQLLPERVVTNEILQRDVYHGADIAHAKRA
jgi:hypothetical protein